MIFDNQCEVRNDPDREARNAAWADLPLRVLSRQESRKARHPSFEP
jgi:hypothetical protein